MTYNNPKPLFPEANDYYPKLQIGEVVMFREYAVAKGMPQYIVNLCDRAIYHYANEVARYASTNDSGQFERAKSAGR